MSAIQGHTIKYKTESGEWVSIPLAVVDVYNLYVQYCVENSIEPVSRADYYGTIGNLKEYADALKLDADATTALQTIAEQLKDGLLPVGNGGTGKSFNNEAAFISYLTEQLVAAGLATEDEANKYADEAASTAAQDKLDSSKIAYGTADPTVNSPGSDVIYYFQHS